MHMHVLDTAEIHITCCSVDVEAIPKDAAVIEFKT